MPVATSHQEYYVPYANGPVLQSYPPLPIALPGTIAASGNWNSGVLISDGYKFIACGVTLSQTGTLSIQRYIDQAGTVAQGAAVTQSLTAATAGVVNVTDGLPFGSFKVSITNSAGSTATPSAFSLLLAAV